ncbi:PadR family transcriptional regulator [Methanocella sp. MCL-LM]|uniref:PadR family transcriptional regulator n=1 Tax=Methanocella sp. MCL-LM TaxID=3412035 RepID=UPI003C766010
MAKTNYAKYIVLGMLSCGPMTGYEMKSWVKEALSYIWDISYGQIYPTLALLEKNKLATMVEEHSAGGRSRKVYQITDKGLDELRAWLRAPETKEYELLLKMCFGNELAPDELIRKLEAYRQKREEEIRAMEEWADALEKGPSFGPSTSYFGMINRLGMAYFREEISWCTESVDMLKKSGNGEKH